MDQKKTLLRRIGRWFLWIIVALLALFILQVTVLAFPQLIIPNSIRAGTVVVYYDGVYGAEVEELAIDVKKRLQASGFYDSSRTDRVFFFQNQNLYTFFARLSMVSPEAQGFALSVIGHSFVSAPRVSALAERTGGHPKYSIWEGSPAHTITHEIGHLYMTDRIGRSKWKGLPQWKQEGIPEYVANIASIREDSLANLPYRIGVLNSKRAWSATWGWEKQGWDRIHYEAGLLVEFLFDVQGYTLGEIVADSVTREETLVAMMAWADRQEDGLPPKKRSAR